jgi:hypothetical protein
MHKFSDTEIRDIVKARLFQVCELFLAEDPKSEITKEYLEHWYFNKDFGTFSFVGAEVDGKVEGISTTNDFSFKINDNEVLVAMPQKVITSALLRGKGFFSKLYRNSEEKCRNINKVKHFLTFTNNQSTQIILEKFSYLRGIAPNVIAFPAFP